MKNQPEKIYLNVGFDQKESGVDFHTLSEVTWSVFKEYDADIEYVKAPQWIKINSEADLPKEITETHVYDDDGDIGYYTFGIHDDVTFIEDNGITHYSPIIKPQPPKEELP